MIGSSFWIGSLQVALGIAIFCLALFVASILAHLAAAIYLAVEEDYRRLQEERKERP